MSKFFIIAGPNVIESEEHCIKMARALKTLMAQYDIEFIFKTSFDKANRSSLNSYRGLGFHEGLRILKRIKDDFGLKITTDIHESWQAKPVAEVADILQIPAFLCRQTDLLKAAAETGRTIHVKKGQFCSAQQMHKCKEKLLAFGAQEVILCERGNSFGYQDLVVDPRNLVWLKSPSNQVSMDITHCLQTPSQTTADGTVQCGGYRDLIPYMGKVARALDVDGLFLEVHDNPEAAMCDGPTQWPLDRLEWLMDYLGIDRKQPAEAFKIPVSNGEIIDKYTILEIKMREISDPIKRNNVLTEMTCLKPFVEKLQTYAINALMEKLKQINADLWVIEDEIRLKEKQGEFDDDFIQLARRVYQTNDERSKIKYRINQTTASALVEEKSH